MTSEQNHTGTTPEANLIPSVVYQESLGLDTQDEGQPLIQDSKPEKLRDSNIKWFVLALTIMSCFGSFYCSDNPQPLQYPIKEIFQIEDTKFNIMFSIILLPNIIAPLIGGILIDSFGIRITMIIFLIIVNIGQAIVVAGARILDFEMMIGGRFIFGVGYQIVETGLIVMVTKWFITEHFTLAWGLARCVLRLASALNSSLTPVIYYETNQLYAPFLFGQILLVFSLVCLFIAAYIDKKAEKQLEVVVTARFTERLMLRDLKVLTKKYFILLVFACLIYTSFAGLTNNINNIFVERFGFNPVTAGSMISILYLIAAVLSPVNGMIADRIGKRTIFLLIGTCLLFLAHFSLIILKDMPQGQPNYGVLVSLISAGLFYAFISTTVWTSLALVVKFQAMGTAHGLICSISSLGQAVYTEALGFVHDNSLEVHRGYYYPQILQCGVMLITFITAIWLYFEDKRTGSRLYKAKVELEKKDF